MNRMYHVHFMLKYGNRVTNSCSAMGRQHISRSKKLSPSDFALSQRLMCSKKPQDDDDLNSDSSSQSVDSKTDRSLKAKAKLDSLLQSIVKDSKEAADKKLLDDVVNMKLAIPIKEKKEVSGDAKKGPDELAVEEDLGVEMVSAVKKVAEVVEGDPQAVESELVQKLKTQVGKKVNLSDLFAGMKIDRSSKDSTTSSPDMELSRAHRVRRLLNERTQTDEYRKARDASVVRQERAPKQRRPTPSKPTYVPIDLFGAPPLGIFPAPTEDAPKVDTPKTPMLEVWETLHSRELKFAITHPPANGFEEMILWTEQGKLWKFPIDNEQGLDEEVKVPFHEHVFLEPQIENWCPKKGPIRHFMELVCVGLSKNPFLTVKEKHQQIDWYHQYFKDKSALVKELGAGEVK